MPQSKDLAHLMSYIGARYTFTPEHYPPLEGVTRDQKKAFAVSHSVYHICKSVGKLAAECERHDHGGAINDAPLKEGTVKMFINAVKLAEELGISAQELADSIPEYMTSK
ncbi:MAG: hypothetical protein ACYC8S_01850 [Minisyncoccota bacterium]